jgi:hypothetical protein
VTNVSFYQFRSCNSGLVLGHAFILGYGLISYNSMVNEISIPNKNRKKTSSLFSNVMISQMIKTEKLKF